MCELPGASTTEEEEEEGESGGDLNLLGQPLPPHPLIGGTVVVQTAAFKNPFQFRKDKDLRLLRISSLFF